jgi:hypothetical protein
MRPVAALFTVIFVRCDADGDGIPAAQDCDDEDTLAGSRDGDADCDGVDPREDCDDGDPLVGNRAFDLDCDGLLTGLDCDDADPESTAVALDADCDGALFQVDCDDTDGDVGDRSSDGDCDETLTDDDCDDDDPESPVRAQDADCDGVPTQQDCDDDDAGQGSRAQDRDCDGVRTSQDCDDDDPDSTTVATDRDCDGLRTAADCDDTDASFGDPSQDADCDRVPTAADCDDADPGSTTIAEDPDCDGLLPPIDCAPDDPTRPDADDADCDGVQREDDCDDEDPELGAIVDDPNCDGLPTPSSGAVSCFPLDGDATNLLDSSRPGVVSGGYWTTDFAFRGGAYELEHVDARLTIPFPGDAFTLSFWAWWHGLVPGAPVFIVGDSTNGLALEHGSDWPSATLRQWSGGVSTQTTGEVLLTPHHHYVLVYDGTVDRATLYRDGAVQLTLAVPSRSWTATTARFGCAPGTACPESPWGLFRVDEITVFDRALGSAEIATLYNEGGGVPCSTYLPARAR